MSVSSISIPPELNLNKISKFNSGTSSADLQNRLWIEIWDRLRVEGVTSSAASANPQTPDKLRISHDRVHEAILIEGRRGEGKTTVLLQMLHDIENQVGEGEKYRSLGLLDPTLLETKQNLILSIVQRIVEYIRAAEDCCGCSSGDKNGHIRSAREALHELSKGVTTLDGVGKAVHDEDWASAKFVLDEGLDRARAAYDFERSFRELVKYAVKAVGCDAFVLGIDDADTKFEMGAPVLEALRKYLTTPYLRVVVSGDPELLQSLTRKLQMQGIGQNYLDFERNVDEEFPNNSRIKTLLDQLSELEDQFLTKVLPPQRRFRLRTMNEISRTSTEPVQLVWRNRTNSNGPLRENLNDLIRELWGTQDGITRRRFREAILSMPIRSIVEFLEVWDHEKYPRDVRSNATNRLLEIARTYLADFGLRIDDIQRTTSSEVRLRKIVTWLSVDQSRWDVFGDLRPHGVKETGDRAIMAISALISKDLPSSTQGALQFWLLFGLFKENVERNQFEDQEKLNGFVEHLQINNSRTLTDFTSRFAAWKRTNFNKESGDKKSGTVLYRLAIEGIPVATDRVRNPGPVIEQFYNVTYNKSDWNPFCKSEKNNVNSIRNTIAKLPAPLKGFHEVLVRTTPVYGTATRSRQGRLSGALYNSIEELSQRVDATSAAILMLPYSTISSGQNFQFGNYSFLKLLAGLHGMTASCADLDDEAAQESIESSLGQWAEVLQYPIAQHSDDDMNTEDDDLETEVSDSGSEVNAAIDATFVNNMKAWINVSGASKSVSAYRLSSVWKKFTDGSSKVFDATTKKTGNILPAHKKLVGVLMHRTIIVFLHSLGVELYLSEGGKLGSLVRGNPTNSDENFIELLTQIKAEDGFNFRETAGGEMFYHLLECPIWAYFLEPDTRKTIYASLNKEMTEPTCQYSPPGTKQTGPIEFDGFYYLLNTVAIPGAGGR